MNKNFIFILLIYFSIFQISKSDLPIFKFRTYPETSETNTLKQSRVYEIVPLDNYQKDAIIFVEQLDGPEVTSTVKNSMKITFKDPYVMTHDKWRGYDWIDAYATGKGPEYIRVSLLDPQTEQPIATFSQEQVKTIYWDFKYGDIKYSFEFEEDGEPGSVFIVAKPATAVDEELEKRTKVWYFTPIEWYGYPSKGETFSWYGGNEERRTQETNRLHVVFNKPRIFYFSFKGYSNFGHVGETIQDHMYSKTQPMNDQEEFIGGAVVLCDENDNCPSLVSGYNGIVYYMKNKIPNDIQLPIQKKKVAIVEGSPLWIRWFQDFYDDPKPNFIEVELPNCIKLDDYKRNHDRTEGTPEHSGMTNYKFTVTNGFDTDFLPLTFIFEDCIEYDKEYESFLRIEGGVFQKYIIIPKKLEPKLHSPKLLTTGFTYSSSNNYKDYDSYINLGFNEFTSGYYVSDWNWDSYLEKRANFNEIQDCSPCDLWNGYNSAQELCNLYDVINSGSVDTDCIPSRVTGDAYNEEIDKLNHAADFYTATGSNHGDNDVAYNGEIYQQHLLQFGKFLKKVKPSSVNLDIEWWIGKDDFKNLVQHSQNAQNRRQSGESDNDLVDRIYMEILYDIKQVIDDNNPGMDVVWFGADATKGVGVGSYSIAEFKSVFGSQFVVQPELYYNHKHPEPLQNIIRANKHYLGNDLRIYPITTFGCWGLYSSDRTFDWVIHILVQELKGFNFILIIMLMIWTIF